MSRTRCDVVALIVDTPAYGKPMTISPRTAINNFRKRYRRAKLFDRIAASLPPRTSSAPPDSAVLLSEALRALTPRQRAALVLTELLGYSAEDAARALGVKVSAIGVLKYRGRTALRQEMEPSDD